MKREKDCWERERELQLPAGCRRRHLPVFKFFFIFIFSLRGWQVFRPGDTDGSLMVHGAGTSSKSSGYSFAIFCSHLPTHVLFRPEMLQHKKAHLQPNREDGCLLFFQSLIRWSKMSATLCMLVFQKLQWGLCNKSEKTEIENWCRFLAAYYHYFVKHIR